MEVYYTNELQNHLDFLVEYSSEYKLDKATELTVLSLGLGGETGEVLEIIKKAIRDERTSIDNQTKTALKQELGDVLAYVLLLANYFDISPDDLIKFNYQKLSSRLERGVIHGSGGNR
jgi:NTP pyrophosphatase (non-canonical NTP hydrolase)